MLTAHRSTVYILARRAILSDWKHETARHRLDHVNRVWEIVSELVLTDTHSHPYTDIYMYMHALYNKCKRNSFAIFTKRYFVLWYILFTLPSFIWHTKAQHIGEVSSCNGSTNTGANIANTHTCMPIDEDPTIHESIQRKHSVVTVAVVVVFVDHMPPYKMVLFTLFLLFAIRNTLQTVNMLCFCIIQCVSSRLLSEYWWFVCYFFFLSSFHSCGECFLFYFFFLLYLLHNDNFRV